jgi:hypothetical protein
VGNVEVWECRDMESCGIVGVRWGVEVWSVERCGSVEVLRVVWECGGVESGVGVWRCG